MSELIANIIQNFTYTGSDNDYDYYHQNGTTYAHHKETNVLTLVDFNQYYASEYTNPVNNSTFTDSYFNLLQTQLFSCKNLNEYLRNELIRVCDIHNDYLLNFKKLNKIIFNENDNSVFDLNKILDKFNELNNLNEDLLNKNKNFKNLNTCLTGQVKSNMKKINELTKMTNNTGNNDLLNKRIIELEESLLILSNEKDMIIHEIQFEKDILSISLSSFTKEKEELEKIINEKDSLNQQYLKDINFMNDKIKDLENELLNQDKIKKDLHTSQLKLKEYENKINILENDFNKMNQNLLMEVNKNKILKKDVGSRDKIIEKLRSENNEIKLISDSLEKSVNEKIDYVCVLEVQCNELKDELKNYEKRYNENLSSSVNDFIRTHNEKINELNEKHAGIVNKINKDINIILTKKKNEMDMIIRHHESNFMKAWNIIKELSQFVPDEFLNDKSDSYRLFVKGVKDEFEIA